MSSFQKKVLAANPNGMVMSFLSNHDMDRIAGAFVTENYMKMAANLYLLSPGSPVIYYGEEIGMRGSRGGAMTDANRRLAMLWGDGDTVKNPTGATYSDDKQIQSTVKTQIEDSSSLYNYYCKLLAIRHKYPAIARGEYTSIVLGGNNLGGFIVDYNGEKIAIIHNNSNEEKTYDLSTSTALNGVLLFELLDCIGVGNARIEGTTLIIGAQTSVIIK
jgi:glycosidase